MTDSNIVKLLSGKYGLTERETRLYYDIYWKRYVLNRMNSLEYDAIEVLNLGVFVPKYKTIRYLLHKNFWLRRLLKKDPERLEKTITKGRLESVEKNLRKLVRFMFLIKKANKNRYIKLK
jgi:hypothetical protein